jgi:hypothetical protein
MRTVNRLIAFTLGSCFCAASVAQTPAAAPAASAPADHVPTAQPPVSAATPEPSSAPAASNPSAAATTPPPVIPSGILIPSLNTVQQTFSGLKLEKWKRGTVRDEAGDNVNEVLHDVKATLPDLMKAADSGPDVVSKSLPLSRNVGALYDVMLRVYEASRVAAPADQVTQIQQALGSLKNARLSLDEHLQQTSEAVEKHSSDLEVTVQKQAVALHAAAPAATPPVCTPPAPKPAVKPKRKPKPATPTTAPGTKPQTTTPTTPATTTKPSS